MPANLSLIYGFPSLLERMMDDGDHTPMPALEEVGSRHFPPVQVLEDNEAFYVRASIPGATLDAVSLTFAAGRLAIQGSLPAPEGLQHRRERPTGPFRRDIAIPCPVLEQAISALMRNGVLFVTLPKNKRGIKRSIPVLGFRSIPQ